MTDHTCKRCGDCCIIHWGSFGATHDDVTRWRKEGRMDILKHLATESDDSNDQSSQFISSSCPFLRKDEREKTYCCTINDTKPSYCKNYPDDGTCEHMEE